MKHHCPVCGWPELAEPPRNASGAASFEICPCCGFEFGFDDDDQGLTYEAARARWVAAGMKWWSTSRPSPANWKALDQFTRAGFRTA
jgi:hypothetical protein